MAWLAIELSIGWALLRPPALELQSPGFDGGKLEINSVPEGANISINGKTAQQRTNTTYVVSPGSYKVAVTGGPGNLNCGEKSVSVSSGSTVTVTCTSKGWQ
jgi:hypothetical protein